MERKESEDVVRVKTHRRRHEAGRKSIDMLLWCLRGENAVRGVIFQRSATVETLSVSVWLCLYMRHVSVFLSVCFLFVCLLKPHDVIVLSTTDKYST